MIAGGLYRLAEPRAALLFAAYKEGRRGGYRISSEEIDNYIAFRSKDQA